MKEPKPETVAISFRFPKERVKELEDKAWRSRRTRSQFIAHAVELLMKRTRKEVSA